jgi:hypothetical protein
MQPVKKKKQVQQTSITFKTETGAHADRRTCPGIASDSAQARWRPRSGASRTG